MLGMGYAYYVVRTRDGFYTKSSLSERTLDPDKATRMKFNKAMQTMRDIVHLGNVRPL